MVLAASALSWRFLDKRDDFRNDSFTLKQTRVRRVHPI
jgi:hypothetical protein